ncbi:unnamed protein product [Linum trigynum]|uniref:Uncharacterized protein n=1 Tax=Linum trigynum TaxID=586398 RepID=A0AAV2G7K1_9ROSI
MASKTPLLAFLVLLIVSCSQVLAGRPVKEDAKQPNFFQSDNLTVRGIGRVLPPRFRIPSFRPYTAPRKYIPGADDTFVPNPGFEVPLPQRGPAAARP